MRKKSFNSILVRLKSTKKIYRHIEQNKFQFHIGAIKIQKFACKTNNLYYLMNKFICQPPIMLKTLYLDDINIISDYR